MPHLKHVERIRIAKEASGFANFAEELSGSIASFVDLRYTSCSANLREELLTDGKRVQRPYTRNLDVVGAKSNEISLEMDVVNGIVLTSAASAPARPDWGWGKILEAYFGGYVSAAGSTEDVGTASAVDSLAVSAGHGSRFTPGSAYAVAVGGLLEARPVASVTVDAVVPKFDHSAAPDDGAAVYNAHTFYLANDPNTTLQLLLETGDRDAIYWALGCQVQSFALTVELTKLVKAAITLRGATWMQDDSVGTPIGGSAMAEGDYSDGGDPTPFLQSHVFFGPAGAASVDDVEVDCETVSVTISHNLDPIMSPRGKGPGILRYFTRPPDQTQPLAMVQMTIPLEDGSALLKTYQAARAARTPYYFWSQHGSTAGNIFCVDMPKLEITDAQLAESNGLHAVVVTAKVLEDSYATDQTTAQRVSPVRFHHI